MINGNFPLVLDYRSQSRLGFHYFFPLYFHSKIKEKNTDISALFESYSTDDDNDDLELNVATISLIAIAGVMTIATIITAIVAARFWRR